jgi:hypothetical protein
MSVTGGVAALDLALEHGGAWLRSRADRKIDAMPAYGCRAASAAHRRCGSAAPTPPRRSAAPTPHPGTPGRPWSWQRCCTVEEGVLRAKSGDEIAAAPRAARLELCPGSRSAGARGPGLTGLCSGAVVAVLAVDHHRARQHQPVRPRGVHRREHHGCVEVVVRGVARRLGEVDACPTINAWWDTASPSGSRPASRASSRTSSCRASSGGVPGLAGAARRAGRARARRRPAGPRRATRRTRHRR